MFLTAVTCRESTSRTHSMHEQLPETQGIKTLARFVGEQVTGARGAPLA